MKNYGEELILDLCNCDIEKFNRKDLRVFCKKLCEKINMVRGPVHFWDYQGYEELRDVDPDHIVGTSVIQFIQTSNITIHCLDKLGKVFINVFSCKPIPVRAAVDYCIEFFGGVINQRQHIDRI